jgi:hypothetical protein
VGHHLAQQRLPDILNDLDVASGQTSCDKFDSRLVDKWAPSVDRLSGKWIAQLAP